MFIKSLLSLDEEWLLKIIPSKTRIKAKTSVDKIINFIKNELFYLS